MLHLGHRDRLQNFGLGVFHRWFQVAGFKFQVRAKELETLNLKLETASSHHLTQHQQDDEENKKPQGNQHKTQARIV